MARNEHTPEQLEAIAAELHDAVNTLNELAALMRQHGMPHALIHGTTSQNFHIPAVLEWVGKTNVDVRSQLRAYLAGIRSRAEIQVEKNRAQQAAEAQKPWKKATKKKKPG